MGDKFLWERTWRLSLLGFHPPFGSAIEQAAVEVYPTPIRVRHPLQPEDRRRARTGVEANQDKGAKMKMRGPPGGPEQLGRLKARQVSPLMALTGRCPENGDRASMAKPMILGAATCGARSRP
jgi:hypothetical protein